MNASNQIIVLFYKAGEGEYIDDEFDVQLTYPAGALTWRREGQMIPEPMQAIFSFDAEDAQQEHSIAFVERLMDFTKGLMTQSEAIRIATKFHRDIRMAIPQGIGWGYFHSHKHSKLLENIAEDEARMERGELASWELELLAHNENNAPA
jgi:hypothetical protein